MSRYKYPRTPHLPWSPGRGSDDKILPNVQHFSGRNIVVTEKMDGENCLTAYTNITMGDMSKLSIRNIVKNNMIGQYVLGQNEQGEIVPSKITNVFYNGTTNDWVNVKIKGPNGYYQKIVCTPNHKFYNVDVDEYVEAHQLQVGNSVGIIDSSLTMTETQKQVLLGKMLGDASISIPKEKGCPDAKRAAIQFSHKLDHREYVEWTNSWIGDLFSGTCIDDAKRYGNTVCIKSWSKFTTPIYDYFINMFDNNIKRVPDWVINDITPLSIAFWYMDDGNLVHTNKQQDRCVFSVCGFDETSCINLQKCLSKFGVDSKLRTLTGYRYLTLDCINTNKLAELITQYIPIGMQYKLPLKYQQSTKLVCLPSETNHNHYRLRKCQIIDIQPFTTNKYTGRYDIETETHNYFANGVLVHNCTLYSDYSHARSIDGRYHPSRAWVKAYHGSIAHLIPSDWRICGENMYAQHSIQYNDLDSYFLAYSIWNAQNEAVSWDTTCSICDALGIHMVRVLYRGIFDEKILRNISDTMDLTNHEGYVVRVEDSFSYDDFGTSVAKFVRKGHVNSDEHWMHQVIIPNKLKHDCNN